jgi:FtsH-binding integral membrane protein
MCPLYYYHQSHPINLVLLGLFTVAISLTVGIVCALTEGIIVLEALILTAAVVVSLTAYTYWAASKGYDFSYLGPILFVGVIILILFGIIQTFFPLGPLSMTIYGVLSSLIFSAYIIYDTDNLIKRYTYDEFVWASVALYLDVINLFLSLLEILRSIQSDN